GLDVGGERVGRGGTVYRIGAAAQSRRFGHDILGVVDEIGVVTEAADHRVGATESVEMIGALVARDDVGGAVAGAIDSAAKLGQRQVLDVRIDDRVGDRAEHRVDAAEGDVGDDIAGVVDD